MVVIIPKLKLFNRKYVSCSNCSFWGDRYDPKDHKDFLGTLCPYCRVKAKLEEMEKRENG